MAKFTWKDTITITTGEMSRAAAIAATRDFNAITLDGMTDEAIEREIDAIIAEFTPASVMVKGQRLKSGKHQIEVADAEPITLSIPVTRATINELPVSLAKGWVQAALAENEWMSSVLFLAPDPTETKSNDEPSAPGQSNDTTQQTAEIQTTG